jgi:RHS repeat-associated protein
LWLELHRKEIAMAALEADGLRTGATETDSTATVTKTWTYDALQRLTQENYSSTISANNYTDQYVYDLVGNRLSKTHTAGTQTLASSDVYNASDQLTTETGALNGASSYSTTYAYDANGSLTSVTRTGSNAETDSYTFDLQNRLSTANVSRTESGQSVTIAATYSYDDSGCRAQGVITTTIGSGSPSTTTTQYVVDSNNPTNYSQVLEEHTNGSAAPNMSYLVGLSVFGQTNASGTTNYLMPDGHGSARLIVDATGAVQARYDYDAYGTALGVPLGVVNPPLTRMLYVTEQFDPNLLAYYLRARYYQPAVARFASLDTFQGIQLIPQSLHKYSYTSDNPTNRIDPTGQFEEVETLESLSLGAKLIIGFYVVVAAGALCGIAYLAQAADFNPLVPDACSPNTMRVQLQDSKNGKTLHTKGLPVTAPSSPGVGVRQVQAMLTLLYQNYANIAPWFPARLDPQLAGVVARVSMRLNRYPPLGGTEPRWYTVEKAIFDDRDTEYRVEVENLRGRNLLIF